MTLQKFLHDFAPFVDITYNTGILFLILLLSFIISAFLASRLRAPFNIFVQEFNNKYIFLKMKYLGKITKIIKQLENQKILLKEYGSQWSLRII